jgi:hypothetical protein
MQHNCNVQLKCWLHNCKHHFVCFHGVIMDGYFHGYFYEEMMESQLL